MVLFSLIVAGHRVFLVSVDYIKTMIYNTPSVDSHGETDQKLLEDRTKCYLRFVFFKLV